MIKFSHGESATDFSRQRVYATDLVEEGVRYSASWKNEAANSKDEVRVMMLVVDGMRSDVAADGVLVIGKLCLASGRLALRVMRVTTGGLSMAFCRLIACSFCCLAMMSA